MIRPVSIQELGLIATASPFVGGAWYAGSVLAKVRYAWKHYLTFRNCLDISNIPMLLAVRATEKFFLDYSAIKVFSIFLLLIARINRLCFQQIKTKQAVDKFFNELFAVYPIHVPLQSMQDSI